MEFRDQSNMESVAHDVYVRWQTVRRRGCGAEHYRVCDSRIAKVDCKWSLFQRWGQVRDIQPESLDNRKNKIRPAVKTSVDLRARSVAHCSPEPQCRHQSWGCPGWYWVHQNAE